MVFRRQMAQITLKAEPLYIVTHIANEPAANENSVIMVRRESFPEEEELRVQGRVRSNPVQCDMNPGQSVKFRFNFEKLYG